MMTSSSNTKETFYVEGMSCTTCAGNVESALTAMPGVIRAQVNFAASTVLVEYHKEKVLPADFQKTLRAIGYDLVITCNDAEDQWEKMQFDEYRQLKLNTIGALVFATPVFIIGMFFMHIPYASWIMLVLTIPVLSVFGRNIFIRAFRQLKRGTMTMDTLVAVSTGIAFIFSLFNTICPAYWTDRGLEAHVYYEAAAVIIALVLVGRLMESRAKANSSSAIRKLIGLQPKMVARVAADNSISEIPIRIVRQGDILVVKPGDRIPVDGLVTEGRSFVDESMISGEPVAVEKIAGTKVFAGTINQKGSLRFVAEKVGKDTLLAQIIKHVREAQGSKAPVQHLADKIASVFVPVVIGISVITFTIWMLAGGEQAFPHALLTAVTVLVIACPCALGLATPTAIMIGIGKGAENNILIKDAESLELMYRMTAVVLDKTGTITEGKPSVTGIYWDEQADPETCRPILLSIESKSEHPLAEAITQFLKQDNILPLLPGDFESITGQGVEERFGEEKYYVGNKQLLESVGIKADGELAEKAQKYQSEGNTVVFFSNSKSLLAIIVIADRIKATSGEAIRQMANAGIAVYMLTGDHRTTARAVAEQTGITHYKAEVAPPEKADFVKQLQQGGAIVAMVGDGINDSQALAQADISIAMGKGSDIAIDVAKVTLITSDLNVLPKAIALSGQTVRTIRQNLFWAFIYNLIGIPLAAGILYPCCHFLLNPMIAAAAMAFSSLSVVGNSLRIKMKKI